MKYTVELTKRIVDEYKEGKSALDIALDLETDYPNENISERSIIAKLSSVGVYKKKEYRTKRGDIPIRKEEYIERIASLLDVNAEILESLEKVNKSVLALISERLQIE